MTEKDGKKVSMQGYIRADIGSNITNIRDMSEGIRKVIDGLAAVLGTEDTTLTDDCRLAMDKLTGAERMLNDCLARTDMLNTDRQV